MAHNSASSPPRNPAQITICRAGGPTIASPAGISSAPFEVQHLLEGSQDGEMTAMRAMLEPGVITHWHSHPRGQILLALSGIGNVQGEGRDVDVLRPGDCVWFPPDLRHWHGASPGSPFVYVSIQGIGGDTAVHWFDAVRSEAR